MTDDTGSTDSSTDSDTNTDTGSGGAPVDGGGEGIELTTGEPNSFEPEEDPDAADR